MSDLISRQAAISAICNACGKIDCDKMDKCEKLQLPPTNCSEFPNNSDTINRQAAIDALGELPTFTQDWSYNTWMYTDDVYNVIKQLPPAEPKRETATVSVGKSKGGATMWYECAACGEPVDQGDTFCSGCGRRMIHG